MIYYSHLFVQSSMAFFCAMQEQAWDIDFIPTTQSWVIDLQHAYWMGGEL